MPRMRCPLPMADEGADAKASRRGWVLAGRIFAGVLGVPEFELALGGGEERVEVVVEVGDRFALLEDLVVESAFGFAGVFVALVAIERGAAVFTGHVPRLEHLGQGSTGARQPLAC